MEHLKNYRIKKIQTYDEYGEPNKLYYTVQSLNTILWVFTKWQDCQERHDSMGGTYYQKIQFTTVKYAQDFIATERRKRTIKTENSIVEYL